MKRMVAKEVCNPMRLKKNGHNEYLRGVQCGSQKIDDTQITNAIDLIWQTFLQFEAPDYSEEGVKSVQEFIENKEIVKTLEFWGAYDEERLKGVIATNENRKHICCFL